MNYRQIDKRQQGYAKRLFSKKLISLEIYGLMQLGRAEYQPHHREVVVFHPGFRYVPIKEQL